MSAFDALVTAAKALEDEAVELEVAGRPIAAPAKLQQAKTKRNEAERIVGMSAILHVVGRTSPVVVTTTSSGTRPLRHRCGIQAHMPPVKTVSIFTLCG